MAFYSAASNASLWKGVDYYKEDRVIEYVDEGRGIISGLVEGSGDSDYKVTIDVDHPRKSTCNCPFADGRKVICKHMIALYFTSQEGSFEAFEEDMRRLEAQYELQEERWRTETLDAIKRRVFAMSAKEAKEKLVDILYNDALDDRYRDDYW